MHDARQPDFDRLEEWLRALSYATRLELLHQLRFPRAVGDVRISAKQVRAGQSAERPMSRQAVEEHLARLVEIGAVLPREAEEGRARREYVANPQRLYQILEEFRHVAAILPTHAGAEGATETLGAFRPPPPVEGPHLVLVHGLREGQTFPLRASSNGVGAAWVVGRKPGIAVPIEYDPYVSLENSEIVRDAEGMRLVALESSRNGTWLNWRRLAPGERAPLRAGDVVGVGRSLLVYRDG